MWHFGAVYAEADRDSALEPATGAMAKFALRHAEWRTCSCLTTRFVSMVFHIFPPDSLQQQTEFSLVFQLLIIKDCVQFLRRTQPSTECQRVVGKQET